MDEKDEIMLAPPDGRDRPYSQPIKWIDWEPRFGVKPPYENPTQEYNENIHVPLMNDLFFRWEGMGFDVEIYSLYTSVTAPVERDRCQSIRRRAAGIPDFNDPEDVRIDTYYDLKACQARIDAIMQELNDGFETIVEISGSLMTGFDRNEVRRPLTGRSKATKEDSLRKFMETKRLLREQSTNIVENRSHVGEGLRDELREAFRDIKHTALDGYSWDEIQAAKEPLALIEYVEEGEIIDARESIPAPAYAGVGQSD